MTVSGKEGGRVKYSEQRINVSVTELCLTALRGGSIDLRRAPTVQSRLEEGKKLHSELEAQRAAKYEGYTAELSFRHFCNYADVDWCISGFADGAYTENGVRVIEEIKTVQGFIPFEPDAQHLAQLRTYGHFLCVKEGLCNIKLILTYYNTVNKKTKRFEFLESSELLRICFENLLDRVMPRAKLMVGRSEIRLPSVRSNSKFPYSELRTGQDELVQEVYRTVKGGKRLFAQAPTGIGKTLSVLYPSVRALADGHADRIFYLTAKASTRKEAFAAAKKMYECGAHLRTCVISAREQSCANEAAKQLGRVSSYCNPEDCPYANGYYDRVDHAIFSLIASKNGFSRIAIQEAAKEFSVCPYELSLDLSELCDIIICDYNYVFDPGVYLRRYFAPDAEKSNNVFLIDEAHNLPDRARDMYSCELQRSGFEAVYTESGSNETELDAALEKVIMFMRGLRRLCRDSIVKTPDGERGFYMSQAPVEGLDGILRDFVKTADAWRRPRREHPLYARVSDLVTAAKKYLQIAEYYDSKFLSYIELLGKDTRVRVFCLDPSGVIGDRMERARSSVLFSATLTPLDYFRGLCGSGGDAITLDLPSPFSPENLCIAAVDTVSTRAEDRDIRTCRKIATYIAATVSAKAGNYICYFPSYDFMDKVIEEFSTKYPRVELTVQKRGMSLAEREQFLSAFKEDTGVLRIGFCVLGGSFSEGVDLPGNRLIGSIVVGAGIPGISNERNILRDYYDLRTDGQGYDYAYTYPGMNAVLQAAGRVIRSDTDRGIVVLIDDRYGTPQYARLFPEQWSRLQFAGNPKSLAEIARRFWNEGK